MLRVRLGLQFQKVWFKITILKRAIWKKWFLKTQLSVWKNRKLAFKILRFQKNILTAIWKCRFLCFQIAIFKNAVPKQFTFYNLV